jgi:hypothetical protein
MIPRRSFRFEIDHEAIQWIDRKRSSERFEGIDFSSSGSVMAAAASEANSVHLFQRMSDGRFEDSPFQIIGGIDYPHDVSFSKSDDSTELAVAGRSGTVRIYQKNKFGRGYDSEPAFKISGPQSNLHYSDGVAFLPPDDSYLAICNLELGTILFFRRVSRSPAMFEEKPEFELAHREIVGPDGLTFSACGRWLATANHGNHTVTIFKRRNKLLSDGKLIFGPEPVTVIEDPQFRYPHSVAFTPHTRHLIITNAGANFFTVHEPKRHYFGMRWSQSPVARVVVNDERSFKEANSPNSREGGPKGVTVHQHNLAICSPEIGIKTFSFRERPGLFRPSSTVDPIPPRLVDTLERFDMSDQFKPLEWHELEASPRGSLRWTGPSPRATIRLPIRFDRDPIVRIHILFTINDAVIDTLRLSVRDQEIIPYCLERLPDGTFLAVAHLGRAVLTKPKSGFEITLEIANTFRPMDHIDGSQDTRLLGLAIDWIELDPT